MSDAVLSLQSIRAKLHQLQMQQQMQENTQSSEAHSFSTPTPNYTQPSSSRTLKTAGVSNKDAPPDLLPDRAKPKQLDSAYPTTTRHQHAGAPNVHQVQHGDQGVVSLSESAWTPLPLRPATVYNHNRTSELSGSLILTTGNTATFEVEDHKARLKKIEEDGNLPNDWWTYIEFLKTTPSEGDIRSKPLSEAYSKAFTSILNSREHRNEVCVRLIMDYVQFSSERFEWDAVDTILDMARGHIQTYAVLIVASAEVKMLKGNQEKALNILSKALAKGRAQPKDLLIRAIKSAEIGQSRLLSDAERSLQVPWVLGDRGCQETDDFKVPPPALGYTDSQIEMATDPVSLSMDDMSSGNPSYLTHPSSASKHPPLRHYTSTPEMRSSAFKAPSSQWSSSVRLKRVLKPPKRVPISRQQHEVYQLSHDTDDDTNLINSIKPLNPSHSHLSNVVSSGYLSDMTIPTEDSTPGQSSISLHKEPVPLTALKDHEEQKLSVHVDSKSSTLSAHPPPAHPPASSSFSAPASKQAAPIMSTPSCKGPQMQPLVMQTPSGEVMETVTVNGEHYCMLKKVGRGGSAKVYMVLDANKNIRALKVVDLEGAGCEVVDGFRNEISLLQRLQYCDSVIKMFNFELNKKLNCLYVVLEYGETDLSGFFSARAKQKQGMDWTLIQFYWREMLRAVNALHKEGIIHSDLKPANFLLVAGNLKLIDFGIANALQQDKTSVLKDSRVGTPSYMSPEAIMAACDDGPDDEDDDDGMDKENVNSAPKPKYKVGVRSDVWSLGCILYNMVYGRTPFQHIKNNMGKLQAITNPTYAIKFPDVPDPHLMDVLKKCLTREVKLRPTTEELLAHPYLTHQEKEDVHAHTPSPASHKGQAPSAARGNGVATTQGSKPAESRMLQELLKSHLVQGSPRTTNAVSRVMDLLQEMESKK